MADDTSRLSDLGAVERDHGLDGVIATDGKLRRVVAVTIDSFHVLAGKRLTKPASFDPAEMFEDPEGRHTRGRHHPLGVLPGEAFNFSFDHGPVPVQKAFEGLGLTSPHAQVVLHGRSLDADGSVHPRHGHRALLQAFRCSRWQSRSLGSVTALRFWLDHWEHECCGDQRKVGDSITVTLSLEGSAEPSNEADLVQSDPDGEMVIIGEARRSMDTEPGLVVRSGDVEFGFPGDISTARVRCVGKLWEERHGSPGGGPATGEVTGRITGLQWHPATYEKLAGSNTRVGFGSPTVIYNTNKFPGYPKPTSPGILRMRAAAARGELTGPFTFTASPMADYQPTGWAFVFIMEV